MIRERNGSFDGSKCYKNTSLLSADPHPGHLSRSRAASRILQSKDITIQEARAAALITENFLRRQRTDSAFEEFYSAVISASQNLIDRRINDGVPSHRPSTPTEMYRQKYYDGLDVMCDEIKRFDQDDLKVVVEIEQLLLDSANGIATTIPESVTSIYRSDLDIDYMSIYECCLMLLNNTIPLACQSERSLLYVHCVTS